MSEGREEIQKQNPISILQILARKKKLRHPMLKSETTPLTALMKMHGISIIEHDK